MDIENEKDLPGSDPEEATSTAEIERVEILDGLAEKIVGLFQERVTMRSSKELEWQQAIQLYNAPLQGTGNLPDTPFSSSDASVTQRRPTPNIVRTKCDTAVANCVSMQFAAGEKNWDLFPPPNATDPAVTESCRKMEKEIEAQLSYCKYAMNSRRAMEERVIYGTGVMKGPVNTGHLQVTYEPSPDGTWIPKVNEAKYPKVTHVPVWRYYPDMSVTDMSESKSDIEIHPMTSIELSQYIQHPGFDGDAIRHILKGNAKDEPIKASHYNTNVLNKISSELWARNPYLYKDRYLVLEYHGPITYDDMEKLGLEPTYESPTMEYYGEVWVCCGKVIRLELENIEGYCETPYAGAIWKRDPTSPFGYGHPLLLADPQRVVTQAYHMILDNASLTSGPQVAMYHKWIQPVDGNWTLAPNKVWLLTDPQAKITDAIQFFNPTNVIGNIMPVLQLARQFAEEESATLASPTQSPDNTDTATGALTMQHAANTNLDASAEEWDDQVTEKIIRRTYGWNMQYNPKNDIKGNYVIDVKSSSEYKNKQMYIRDLERLQMETTQNPAMAMVINADELVKARLALMHLPGNRIIKSDDEIAQAQQQAQEKPDPAMLEIQLKQAELKLKEAELQLKGGQLQFELKQAQQREAWEHEEKMGSNQARLMEAQAQVLKARSEVQVEMLQMAQKDKHVQQSILNDREMQSLELQSNAFLKSMELQTKAQENSLYQQELDIKKDQGSGI